MNYSHCMTVAALLMTSLLVGCQQNDPSVPAENVEQLVDEAAEKTLEEKEQKVEKTKAASEQNDAATNENTEQPVTELQSKEVVQEPATQSLFDTYSQKLDAAAAEVDTIYATSEALTTVEMNDVSEQAFNVWDDLLNDMYGVLKAQLPAAEFEALRAEQREWIGERDEYATYIATEAADGGSAYTSIYIDAQMQYTAQRCSDFLYEYFINL